MSDVNRLGFHKLGVASGGLWRRALLVAMVVVGAALVACQTPATPPAGQDVSVTVDEILANPQRFESREVTADAQVDRVVNEHVIALRAQTTGQEMLVILGGPALAEVDSIVSGDQLTILGTVQLLTRDQIRLVEQELNIRLDQDQLLNLANQAPFMVAVHISP